MGDIDKMM